MGVEQVPPGTVIAPAGGLKTVGPFTVQPGPAGSPARDQWKLCGRAPLLQMFRHTVTVPFPRQIVVTCGTRQYSGHFPAIPAAATAAADWADSGVLKISSSSRQPSKGAVAPTDGFTRPMYRSALLDTLPPIGVKLKAADGAPFRYQRPCDGAPRSTDTARCVHV